MREQNELFENTGDTIKRLEEAIEEHHRTDSIRFLLAEALAKGLLQAVDGFVCFFEERVSTGDVGDSERVHRNAYVFTASQEVQYEA